jgi:hypothetical protein
MCKELAAWLGEQFTELLPSAVLQSAGHQNTTPCAIVASSCSYDFSPSAACKTHPQFSNKKIHAEENFAIPPKKNVLKNVSLVHRSL